MLHVPNPTASPPPSSSTEVFDCLLACLQAISGYFERPSSATILTAGLPLEDGRLTPSLTIRAAGRVGLAAANSSMPLRKIVQDRLPAILLLRDGGCIAALRRLPGGAIEVKHPGDSETRSVTIDALDEHYRRQAILLEATMEAGDIGAEQVSSPQSHTRVDWFWGTVRRHWRSYAQIAVAACLINLFALALPLFIMNVYNRVLPNEAISTLLVLASGILLVILFDLMLKTARAFLIDSVGRRVDAQLSSSLFEKTLAIPLANKPSSTGAFAGIISQYEYVREFFTSNSLASFIDFCFIFLFIGMIYHIAGWIALIPLTAAVLIIAAGLVLQKLIGKSLAAAQSQSSVRQGLLVESIAGIETIKSLGAEGHLVRKWDDVARSSSRTIERTKRLSSIGLNFSQFVQQLVSVLIILAAVYEFTKGTVSSGAIIATMILASRAVGPLSQIAMLLTRARQAFLSIRLLDQIMALPEDRPAGRSFVNRSIERGKIAVRSVKFRYPEIERFVLENVSFLIAPGEKVGIIGRIGSGKTTIGRLLAGLYYPTEGEIILDGVDIRQYHPSEVRRQVGLLVQDADLFRGSVRDNIKIADPLADDEAVLSAAKLAGVDEFVSRHPMGYDMPVGERGSLISGGQRQAIALARLLLRRPKIMFLDEPSSSMDLASERQLIRHLKQAIGEADTVIIATHRHSLLSLIDRLLVLDAGRIVADGPRDEVLAALQNQASKAGS